MTFAEYEVLSHAADAAEREALDAEAHLGKFVIVYLDLHGSMPTHGEVVRMLIADARTKRDIARRTMHHANLALDEVLAA